MSDTGTMQYAHHWIYVIIPVQQGYRSYNNAEVPPALPMFAAWCKQPGCSKSFTQILSASFSYYDYKYSGVEGQVNLPEFGCVEPRY